MTSWLDSTMLTRPVKLGYSNARVKAMKALLMQKREIEAIAEAKNIEEVFSLLEKTSYRPDLISGTLAEKTLADQIEIACTKNFSRTLRKILKLSPPDARASIMSVFEKYEIENIKLLLTSKHLKQSKEKIQNLVLETGILPRGAMSRLIAAKDVMEGLAALEGTPYASAIEKSGAKYEGNITPLLAALDDYYYKKMQQMAKQFPGEERAMLKMLKSVIDAKNISVILRSKKENMGNANILKFITAEGNINKDKMRIAVRAKNTEEALKLFEKHFGLTDAIQAYQKTGSLIPVEIEIEKSIAKRGLNVLRRSVLSISAIAGFLLLKEEEVNNIRKIIRAKEFNLPYEKLKEMLVIV